MQAACDKIFSRFLVKTVADPEKYFAPKAVVIIEHRGGKLTFSASEDVVYDTRHADGLLIDVSGDEVSEQVIAWHQIIRIRVTEETS